jgi:hypothetical protein
VRISQASLALIERTGPGGATEYLTQWNDRWQAYSLIGGHIESGESYRDCCIREVAEELGLAPEVDFRVAPQPLGARCQYTALSQSAGVPTEYQIEIFATELLLPAAVATVSANPHNRWSSLADIQRGSTADGRTIAQQVVRVLGLIGVIPTPGSRDLFPSRKTDQ